ncbi:hypothetical protein CROQUDRAFT_487474 [Cronartium quercuum f. sp. fusiforme G11]|uniref:Pericentrin/AKAP-450 centrosomal targeting domain-containing protein n=1 Tax=Cronartium quercuum f. sp. fusiforme G11 TaxID=708437 RepID=A0A9P6TC78_9BASI|nr:hypothetical protein CROQUDRAFT_487474 [Cronartium quercuum f. sp. fusiforme G11]
MTDDTENKTADTYNNSQLSVHNIRKMNRDMQQLRDDLQTKTQHLEELLAKQESEEQTLAQLREELNQTQEELNTVTGSLEEQEARCHQAEAECNRMDQEKRAMEERLRKTEVELSKAVNARDCTAAELRALQNHKGEADGLSRQLSKAQATIDSLEEEKDSLGQQIDDLRHQIEHQSDLIRNSERKSVGLQRSVDEQHRELTDLRGTLEMKSAEIVRLRDLKDDVLNQAENLRDDLLQVRNEAEELAHDLQTFKQQQRQSNNPSARASAKEVVKLREELLSRKKQMAKLMDDQEKHVCSTEPRTLSVADQKKHSAESKGLLLRIRFLKLLFTRESYFRADLAAQKHMLLTKLGQTEIRNEAIQLALDKFGLPSAAGQAGNFTIRSDERSFKGVAMAVRAVCKLKILSQKWKEEERAKQKLKDAYQKVRGKAFEA